MKVDGPSKSGRSGAKLDCHLSESVRSGTVVNGHGSKKTVIRLKVDGPLDESKNRSGRFKSVKADGPTVSKWTVKKCQTGRSDSVQLVHPNPKCTLTLNALSLSAP